MLEYYLSCAVRISKKYSILYTAFAAAFFLASCTTDPVGTAPTADVDVTDNAPAINRATSILGKGGFVLVLRHGKSPHDQTASVGLSAGCLLAEGRGLSPAGFAEARAMGSVLAEANVPIYRAYTSDLCRAFDTASLVAGGAPVIPHAAQKTTDPGTIVGFKKEIEQELIANPDSNIILASHSNVAPLYGAAVRDGEDELPEGVVSIVNPENWQTVARITFDTGTQSGILTVD